MKLQVPNWVGVPEMVPVVVFNERPGGNVPLVMDHWNGSLPPEVATVVEYADRRLPSGSLVVVIVTGAVGCGAIVIVSARSA